MRQNKQSALFYKQSYLQKRHNKNVESNSTKVLGMTPVQAMMTLIVLIFMSSYLVYSKVTLDKIGNEIVKYEKIYEDLLNEKIRLEVDMESKISLKNIEESATKLGLAQIQDYQIEYVDFKSEDNIELTNKKNKFLVLLKNYFNEILAYIR